jgi:hypothetical protein
MRVTLSLVCARYQLSVTARAPESRSSLNRDALIIYKIRQDVRRDRRCATLKTEVLPRAPSLDRHGQTPHLAYIRALPPNNFAHIALLDTLELAQASKPGWLVDVLWSWRKLDKPLIMDVPELVEYIRNSSFDALITQLHDLAKAAATVVINNAPKLELIRGPRERNREGQLVAEVYRLRDSLLVPIATHHMALTRLLLSGHVLAVEQMRRAVRGQRRGVPRDQRIVCRFRSSRERG